MLAKEKPIDPFKGKTRKELIKMIDRLSVEVYDLRTEITKEKFK